MLCVLAVLFLFASDAHAGIPCESIKNLVFLDTTITISQSVPALTEVVPIYFIPDQPHWFTPIPICRVVGHIHPSSDSDSRGQTKPRRQD